MKFFLFLSGTGVCWLGSFFIAAQLFKRVWNGQATYLKLLGFVALFSVSFIGMMVIVMVIASRHVPFGR